MKSDFLIAITQVCAEKNVSREVVLDAIEQALISAYKRNYGMGQNISVKIMPQTAEFRVYAQKTVVEAVTDPQTEITLAEARQLDPLATIGSSVEMETTPANFGRIAAQTAKQVVLQRLREAERGVVFDEYREREGEIIGGVISRLEPPHGLPRQAIIDLGKAEAILPSVEMVNHERYRVGQRLKVYVVEVRPTAKGPQVIVSRTHRDLLRRLFELEVPEIYNGVVEIKSIAREAGVRSKVAVAARQEGVDPVGSCVGLRGIRIQNIVRELNDEKIDVVQWHADPGIFVANALSPAHVLNVDIDPDAKTATVVVPDGQLSLAIGKEGQNARLAAKLTGWRIDIKKATQARVEREEREAAQASAVAALPAPEPVAAEPALAAAAEPEPVAEAPLAEPVVAEPPALAEPVAEAPAIAAPAPLEEPAAAEPTPPASEWAVAPTAPPPPPAPRRQIRFAEELFIPDRDREITPAPTPSGGKPKKKGGRREEREERVTAARGRKSDKRSWELELDDDLGDLTVDDDLGDDYVDDDDEEDTSVGRKR